MDKDNLFHLSRNLYFLRNRAKMTQSDIQENLGIMRNTWSNWENEKSEPNLDSLHKISSYFHIGVGDLLSKDLTTYGYIPPLAEKDVLSASQEPFALQCPYCKANGEIVALQKQLITALQGQIDALKSNFKSNNTPY